MVYTYFEIGRIIVEEEQSGKDRAEYGKQILKGLSKQLTNEFGKGFSVENLDRMRKFYRAYSISSSLMRILELANSSSVMTNSNILDLNSEIENAIISKSQSLTGEFKSQKAQSLISFFKLTWTHYVFLMRIDDEKERRFYEIESEKYNWSVRELKRQYDSALYTRLALSRDKEGVLKLSQQGQIIEKPKDIIKDPYILEFLGLPELH